MKYIKALTDRFLSSKWRSRRQKVLAGLMAFVVFVTTYALILPAITLDVRTAETEPGIEAEQTTEETLGQVQDESYLAAGQQIGEGAAAESAADESVSGQEATSAEAAAELESASDLTKGTDAENSQAADTETAVAIAADTDTEEESEEVYAQSPLIWHSKAYDVEISFDSEEWQLPENTVLTVKELDNKKEEDKDDYKYYDERARKELKEYDEELEKRASVNSFYKLTLQDDGRDIDVPEGAADITIHYNLDDETIYKEAKVFENDEEFQIALFSLTDEKPLLFDENWDESDVISLDDDRISEIKIKDLELSDFENVIGLYVCPQPEEKQLPEVDGKVYEFELPEEGFASMETITEDIVLSDQKAENENGEEAAMEAKDFVAEIEKAEFSDPDLVWVGKLEEDTTVGTLKEENELEIEYPEKLTDTQIEEINAQEAQAGDWALIGMRPFDTEEDLTVTMKTGEVFTVKVTAAQISKDYISADGETYTITVTYTEEAQIPEGAKLKVEEILPEDDRYQEYCEQAAVEAPENAHFFDITIMNGNEKIEPKAPVNVDIKLTGILNAEDILKVVHFAEAGLEIMKTTENIAEGGETVLSFETDSFSVYGVIVDEEHGEPPLTEQTVKIGVDGQYLTNRTNYNKTPWEITKTNDINQAAEYHFEAGDTPGTYRVYTMVNGQKTYMHINHQENSANNGNVNLTNQYTMDLHVVQNADGTYGIYRNDNGRDYYLNRFGGVGGTGFAAYTDADGNGNSKLTFVSSGSDGLHNGAYIVLAKIDEYYYIVNNDGTLTSVEYDESTNKVKVENPMLWTYTGDHLYHNSEAVDFDGSQVASDFYYKYLNPNTGNGWAEDTASNTEREVAGYRGPGDPYYKVKNGSRQMWTQSALSYSDHHLVSTVNENSYIGVAEENGVLKLVGQVDAANAAEIYFAIPENVAPVDSNNHTVSHIDISIEGSTEIDVPLAYGKYYDKDGNEILNVTENKSLNLHKDKVGISTDDMKKATIIAYTKNADGQAVPIDDAFYITGYSANAKTEYSTPQVRIEGSFKVADLELNKPYTGQDRLDHKIYYSVTAIKTITFDLVDEELGQLYDVEGNPLTITVDVAFSASFDYWDERNECPPVRWSLASWRQGEIPGGSGMDFVLGGDAEEASSNIVAVEITKLIVDEFGHRIKPDPSKTITNSFGIWQNKGGNPNSVIGLDINQYTVPADYDQYVKLHSKNVKVGSDGMGIVYDYDVSPGMFYIEEDPESIPETITDTEGETWHYAGTRIETEYPWRAQTNYNKNDVHVSDTYTKEGAEAFNSIPEVLGPYTDINGKTTYFNEETQKEELLRNGFLEFYVYNIYEPEKTELKVLKEWENGSAPEGAGVDVVLKRYKLVPDGSITPPEPTTAALTITDSYSGLGGDKTYSATYHVTGPNDFDQTYNWTGSPIVIPDLPFGDYTVAKTATAQDGYDAQNLTEEQRVTLGVAGASVTFNETVYQRQSSETRYRRVWVYANDTLNMGQSKVVDGHYTWVDEEYPEGSSITFQVGVPAWNNNSTYSYRINDGSAVTIPTGETKTETLTVDRDITIVIYGTTPYYSQWLNPEPSVTMASGQKSLRMNSARRAPGRAAAVINLSNGGKNPEIEGYSWQEDSTWYDGNGLLVHLPDGTSWEKTVEDLEKEDAYGNVYVYYIDSVTETGMPSGMTAQIVLDGENKLFVYGDHSGEEGAVHQNDTLLVKNILATGTDITIAKVKKDTMEPLSGAEFTIRKYTNSSHMNEIREGGYPMVGSVDADGILSLNNLEIGYYKIEESKTPEGYVKVSEDPFFEVKRDDQTGEISVEFENTSMVTYEDGTFKVQNEPGAVLPSTGGPGTGFLTILGLILIAGTSGALLARRKRKGVVS